MQSHKKIALYQTFFLVIFLILFDTTLAIGGGGNSNPCTTYSCGVCCHADISPCCNIGYRRPLRADIPLNRTFSKNVQNSSSITITESDIRTTLSGGKTHLSRGIPDYTQTFSMDIGIADPNNAQSWTIPNNLTTLLSYQHRLSFIVGTEVPASVSAAFSTNTIGVTPTHWAKETVDKNGVSFTCYHFLDVGQLTPGLSNLGKVYMRNSDGQVFYDNSVLSESYTDIPISLGSSYPIFSNYLHPENTGFSKYTQGNITYDAYGTITTPYGTFECLRGSYTEETQQYLNGFGVGTPDTTYWVMWTTREGFRFYGRKPSENASGETVLANIHSVQVVDRTVLPVELLQFNAKSAANQTVTISWKTASEKDNAIFEVQRTTDGKNFETIGTVRGAINSAQTKSYQLVDNTPSVGHNYYRLRQTDTNGNETFSPLEYVWIKPEKGFLNIYPNPANDILNIEFEQAKEMTITDAAGKTVKSIPIENGHFLQKQTISIQDLPTGVYFLQANIKGENKTLQFVKK